MAMTKERERPQWQEVPALPKRRQDWRLPNNWSLPNKREEQKSHGIRKILLGPSMNAEKSAFMRRSNRLARLRSENPIVRSQNGRTSWLLDARKLNPNSRLRDNLLEAAREKFVTNSPTAPAREREEMLLKERNILLDLEDAGTLSGVQEARLYWVEAQLDQLEDQDPVEQEADRRLARTGDKLDEILSLLRSLPRKDPEDTAR